MTTRKSKTNQFAKSNATLRSDNMCLTEGKQWRKVLYERGTFPDNYTPAEFFLAAIKKNKNLYEYTFQQCLQGASQVALQMSAVLLFVIAYNSLDSGTISSETILGISMATSILGYLLHIGTSSSPSITSILRDMQHVSIFLIFGLGLSPVLYKLTDTISTDTIHTTSGFMLFVHLVFHNYGLDKAAIVSNALSLNAALFAAVCLASRLVSSYDAFVLLSLSVVAFVLFPIFRLELYGRFLVMVTLITVVSVVALTAQFYALSASVCASLAFVLVIGVCPALFVRWQTFKHTIHGPWDEAVPNFTTTKTDNAAT